MKLILLTLTGAFFVAVPSFAAECSAFIQMAVQPPVANTDIQLTKRLDVNNQNIEHFVVGSDQVLKINELRVFIDVNNLDKSVKVLLGQKNRSVASFEGAFSMTGTFKTSLSFNGNSELVINCKE